MIAERPVQLEEAMPHSRLRKQYSDIYEQLPHTSLLTILSSVQWPISLAVLFLLHKLLV